MTFTLEQAAIQRARVALDVAATGTSPDAKIKAFVQMAFAIIGAENVDDASHRLKSMADQNTLIERAVSHGTGDTMWASGAASELAASYLASIAEYSLLDAIKPYARVLPTASQGKALIATGGVGDVVSEGSPIPARNMSLSLGDVEPVHSAAMVVLSDELLRIGGAEVLAMFEQELAFAVGRVSNRAVLSHLVDSSTKTVAGVGDPLADLRTGLRAAGPANGYVVGMPSQFVADLATRSEAGPGFGIRGGVFRRGLSIVALDDVDDVTVIPASRLAVYDFGVRMRAAGDATIEMAAVPVGNSITPVETELVSLWQCGLRAMAVDRRWHLAGDNTGAVIVQGVEA